VRVAYLQPQHLRRGGAPRRTTRRRGERESAPRCNGLAARRGARPHPRTPSEAYQWRVAARSGRGAGAERALRGRRRAFSGCRRASMHASTSTCARPARRRQWWWLCAAGGDARHQAPAPREAARPPASPALPAKARERACAAAGRARHAFAGAALRRCHTRRAPDGLSTVPPRPHPPPLAGAPCAWAASAARPSRRGQTRRQTPCWRPRNRRCWGWPCLLLMLRGPGAQWMPAWVGTPTGSGVVEAGGRQATVAPPRCLHGAFTLCGCQTCFANSPFSNTCCFADLRGSGSGMERFVTSESEKSQWLPYLFRARRGGTRASAAAHDPIHLTAPRAPDLRACPRAESPVPCAVSVPL
jgi:hypothetical protein